MKPKAERQFVWDIPTRLFHWLLVALFAFSWWSAKNDHMDWHLTSGLIILGLLAFRILWGLVGADTARFAQFVKGPLAIWTYLRSDGVSPKHLGHNPLGGWSVVALLFVLCLQVVSGLFAVDVDGIESGPLSYLVSFDQGRAASALHYWSFDLLLVLIGLHLAAIAFYLIVRRRNLIWTMVTGFAPGTGAENGGVSVRSPWRLLFVVLVSVWLAYAVAKGFRL